MHKNEFITKIKPLIQELCPILKKNNNDTKTECILEHHYFQDGITVKITAPTEYEKYESVVNFIMEQKEFNMFSKKILEDKLNQIYHDILVEIDDLDLYLENFYLDLQNNKNNHYFVLSELENIRINDSKTYKIIDSTIKLLKVDDLPFDKTELEKSAFHFRDYLDKICIFTNVVAGDIQKAEDFATHNFIVSFNLLRLYATSIKPALKGTIVSGTRHLNSYNITKSSFNSSTSKTGDFSPNKFPLDAATYSKLKEAGVSELQKKSEITKVVKESLYWFGLGLDEKHPSAKLLNFVTVLESTLKRDSENTELKRLVSERGALLLHDDFESRKGAYTDLGKIYSKRSTIVHTGALIDDVKIMRLAGGYARSVLIKLIQSNAIFNGNFDKFIEKLDDGRFITKKSD
jgi:hypothetical protein